MADSNNIELNEENCIELLKRFLDVGFSNGNSQFTVADGAQIHKAYRMLKGQEKLDDSLDIPTIYKALFNFIEIANKGKAYKLDDVAVIHTVMVYINENVINKPEVSSEASGEASSSVTSKGKSKE